MKKNKGFKEKWMKFANKVARVQTIVIMTVIYFLLVPFFSLIRLWDPLKLRLKKTADSYWEPKGNKAFSIDDMRNMG